MTLTRRGEVLAGVLLVAGLVLASGCDDPNMRNVGEVPLCTPTHHDAPCVSNGDNEPTVTMPKPGEVIEEDDPRFDCHLDGNHGCGPDAPAWISDRDRTTGPPAYYASVTEQQNERVKLLPDSWACGEGTCLYTEAWKPLPSDWVDAMYEGDDMTPATAWENCWLSIGDTSYVVCPDGTIETS